MVKVPSTAMVNIGVSPIAVKQKCCGMSCDDGAAMETVTVFNITLSLLFIRVIRFSKVQG